LQKKIIRWWYFTCKKSANIICDGILHVNMFHYFKIPYFICNFSTKFTYNEYIGRYFLSHVVLRFSPNDLPGRGGWVENKAHDKATSRFGLQEEWPMLLCGGCGWLMPSLGHGQHQNHKGVDSHVDILKIIFVSLVNHWCVQQIGSII
jgi:hypothetical protein